MFNDIVFLHPKSFYLLLLLIPLIGWYIYKLRNMNASFSISSVEGIAKIGSSWKVRLRHLPFLLRVLALIALVIVLARPQSLSSTSKSKTEGIDIVMALDVSSSMLAEDLKPNRMMAAKEVALDFVKNRPNDKIGLVIFSGESFTQCPLTNDHAVLLNLINEVKPGMIEDGTAIGLGLGTAVNRLKDSDSKSRVIILLTDGANNAGALTPMDAAQLAKDYGIRLYTIGAGSRGTATYTDPRTGYKGTIEADIDDTSLAQMASLTRGEYFRATDTESLKKVYQQIDEMEKRHISVNTITQRAELYLPYALLALALIALELILRRTIFRTIP